MFPHRERISKELGLASEALTLTKFQRTKKKTLLFWAFLLFHVSMRFTHDKLKLQNIWPVNLIAWHAKRSKQKHSNWWRNNSVPSALQKPFHKESSNFKWVFPRFLQRYHPRSRRSYTGTGWCAQEAAQFLWVATNFPFLKDSVQTHATHKRPMFQVHQLSRFLVCGTSKQSTLAILAQSSNLLCLLSLGKFDAKTTKWPYVHCTCLAIWATRTEFCCWWSGIGSQQCTAMKSKLQLTLFFPKLLESTGLFEHFRDQSP